MYLHNSFSEKKEKVDISQPIGLYVCGITPYDTTHLGHAFTFLIYDVLVRYLRFLGARVTYVQNVTDIDDDILIKAKSSGVSWRQLGQRETNKHVHNMQRLNALQPDIFPKASAHITPMIRIIEVLLKKDLAYVKNGSVLGPQSSLTRRGPHGSVYFEIKKDKNFGKFSKYGYRAMLQIANDRGNFPQDPNKRDPLDFVLWQKYKRGEPFWISPWGKGRPGWHIECSAMSLKYLGPTVTIHGGGEDLIFPHHEAEIAQSENVTGKKFVKIWIHTAMVYCDGKKMSKSLGNMIFMDDLLKKYSANTIRILLLSHHYRQSWNYQEKELKEAQRTAVILEEAIATDRISKDSLASARLMSLRSRMTQGQEVKKLLPEFFKAIDDDLNIPKALKILVSLAKSSHPVKGELVVTLGQILGLVF